jgi:medium-chain acyl-[acyl-carrier-protein] hydrolase
MMSADRWLLCSRPLGAAPWQLFCFPHAGAGTSPYAAWSAALAPDVEVTAVCPPGRERHIGAPPHRAMDTLVEALLPVIRPRLRPPYAFFGHSLGALVAFALALALEQENRGPARLIVSSAAPPHLAKPEPRVCRLDDAGLIRQMASYGGFPLQVAESAELLRLVLPTLRADIEIAEHYSVGADYRVRCPVTAFGGLSDAGVPPRALTGWRALTDGPFGLSLLPGGHFYLISQRESLLNALRLDLGTTSSQATPARFYDRIEARR